MNPLAGRSTNELILIGLGALAVVYFGGKFALKTAGGLVSGNNVITQNQTNAAGQAVTAYQGAGVFGTLGAAANSASGGYLSSFGETLGGWAFDAFGPRTDLSLAPSLANAAYHDRTFDYTDIVPLTDIEISRLRPRGGA